MAVALAVANCYEHDSSLRTKSKLANKLNKRDRISASAEVNKRKSKCLYSAAMHIQLHST